ncbi:MAG TPA: hypothetical protein PL151_12245 [Phycisphaerae bacterium]|nr:hypothetical protein [Phycisphaerae bacterium]HOJ74232.1 hypothetical protein [Phycisphaerae bacterium]HOM51311.1 hypothetical protein [Phycisphaerae bacterium]HOQ86174.1 hypothetical protein [Phycisphaerae bacterium]HPP26725.1 hypothetical protein [Phycisphaerae bacterium]
MVIHRNSLKGLEIDLAGAAAVIALAVVGYVLLLDQPLRDMLAGKDLEERQEAATQAIHTSQAEYRTRLRALEEARSELQLRSRGLTGTGAPGEVLARINELARQCDVRISRWQPQNVQLLAEYQQEAFSLDGVATWPALLQWLALVEEGVPLLDVTHITISTPVGAGQIACEFSCSLRLYRGKAEQAVQMAVARP